MAYTDVVKFIDRIIRDAVLRAKLKDMRAINDEEAMEQLIKIASHFGYPLRRASSMIFVLPWR
ncbi:MAG: hypothetical protein GY805_01990 [Chloroflexi bacterium]|nr:hypothetical protein [Chloroflexota bacterium]